MDALDREVTDRGTLGAGQNIESNSQFLLNKLLFYLVELQKGA